VVGRSEDAAVVDEDDGFVVPCDWLFLERGTVPHQEDHLRHVTVARLAGEPLTTISVPPGWDRPQRGMRLTKQELEEEYEKVREDPVGDTGGYLVAYRHRTTHEMLYMPQRDLPEKPDVERLIGLQKEFATAHAMPTSRRRDERLRALYEEASRGVQSSGGNDPRWLLLQAQVAMVTTQWKTAEQALRRLTQVLPMVIEYWFDLTMVLSERVDRLDEAEAVALQAVAVDPNSSGAYGRLANVLRLRGKTEAAMRAVNRALELDPANVVLRRIHGYLVEQVAEESAQPLPPVSEDAATNREASAPWYKRVFRR
jgi:Flp pilus assembly protein TadD